MAKRFKRARVAVCLAGALGLFLAPSSFGCTSNSGNQGSAGAGGAKDSGTAGTTNKAGGGGSGSGGAAGSANSGTGGINGSSGNAGYGGNDAGTGSIPAPSGTGDKPNLRVIPWNGKKAAVSLTFDDADPAHYTLAGPALGARGLKATFFVVANTIKAMGASARSGFADLKSQGHELGNHTMTHAGSSAPAASASEVTDCESYLVSTFGVTPNTFAYPNVDVTSTYKDPASARYVASRGGGTGEHITVSANPDWHNLPSWFLSDPENDQGYLHHPDETVKAIDDTVAASGWRILTFHGIGSDGFWANTSVANLTLVLDRVKSADIWVDTFAHVAGYLRAHKALASVTPMSAGTTTTWTWTLAAGFPPQVMLRVLIDGGKLSQDGMPLQWNGAEGYYPVDPKKLSLVWTR